jgi:tetratricopeptide (TPR) repeat protein
MWIIIFVCQLYIIKGDYNITKLNIWCFYTLHSQYVDELKNSNLLSRLPIFLFFSLLFTFQALPVQGVEPFPLQYISSELDRNILKAESLVMDRHYEEARSSFDDLEKKDPESILPSMGRLLVLMTQSLEKDAQADLFEESFQREFKKNREILKRMEKRADLNAWDHFLMGGSLGVQGLYELQHGRYVPAFMHGLSGLSHFKKAKEMDPEIHDVFFATGLYKYFRSVKTRYLWFLPLIRDQREEGVEEIHQALKKGHYAEPACKIALVMLAEKENDVKGGIRMGEVFLAEYPRNLLIRQALGKIYERQGLWFDAARTYRNGYAGDASTRWVLLQAGRDFVKANAPAEAEESFRKYLASGPPPSGGAQAHMELSRLYRSSGELSRSLEERERAVLLDPTLKESPSDD